MQSQIEKKKLYMKVVLEALRHIILGNKRDRIRSMMNDPLFLV